MKENQQDYEQLTISVKEHPKLWEPTVLIFSIVMCVLGCIIGMELIVNTGTTPNTSLVGALFAILISRIPITLFKQFRSVHRQNLIQTAISGATFSIANCMLLTIGVPYILGRHDLVVPMLIGVTVTTPMLRLLETPVSIIDWSGDYLHIIFWGVAGCAFYNILSGILRGMGDSFSALAFLLLATVLNIGLDVWFVAGFGMGVAGVALATVLAQGISAALCMVKLLRMQDVFDFTPATLRLRRDCAARIIHIGVPSGVTQAIMSLAMLVVQSLTNSMGETVIACNVIIMRVDGFAMMPNMSFGQAMSVYTGQNVGAGKLDRVIQGRKQGTAMAVGLACAITACLLLFGRHLFALFTDTEELIVLAGRMMRIMAAGYIAIAVSQVLGGVMRGAGDTVTPMWISLFTTIFMRVPVAYALAYLTRCEAWPNGRPEALSVSLLVPWVMGAVISYIAFRRGSWRKRLPQMMNAT